METFLYFSTSCSERTPLCQTEVTATSESRSHLNTAISKFEASLLTFPAQITSQWYCINPISGTKLCIEIGDLMPGVKSNITSKVLNYISVIACRFGTEIATCRFIRIRIRAYTAYAHKYIKGHRRLIFRG